MTLVGVIGVLLGLLAYPFAMVRRTRLRIMLFLAAYALHLLAAVVFYQYVQDAVSDSHAYYYDPFGFADAGFGIGTQFVFLFTQGLKSSVGGTYLDFFLLFQSFGFLVIASLMRIFEEIFERVGVEQPVFFYFIIFLPGLHFWTSALGKDALLVPAIAIAIWATINLRRRRLIFALALAIMFLIRPHIALLSGVALAGALVLGSRANLVTKALMLIGALFVVAIGVATVQTTFAVDVTSAESIGDFLTSHEASTSAIATSETSVRGGFLFRAFSLLFRPLFIDAVGVFGLIASFENLILLFVFVSLTRYFREVIGLVRDVTFIRFAFFLAVLIGIFLSLINYNLGLALRQKMMIVPPILIVYAAAVAMRRRKTAVRAAALRNFNAVAASR